MSESNHIENGDSVGPLRAMLSLVVSSTQPVYEQGIMSVGYGQTVEEAVKNCMTQAFYLDPKTKARLREQPQPQINGPVWAALHYMPPANREPIE